MAGTKMGGKNAAATNKAKYGSDFYARIGAMGGRKGTTGGFAFSKKCDNPDCEYKLAEPEHLVRQCAGFRGGKISRRTKNA